MSAASPWIIRCANRKCRHVCSETDWVLKSTKDFLVSEFRCPKCDSRDYYKANAKERKAWAGSEEGPKL
jgi:hypothetical protein